MPDPRVEILSQTPCHLGEGAFYCERRNTLYWFDIVGKRRYAHDFNRRMETFINLPEMASAMAVIDDKRDAIFTETGLWIHEVGTGCWSPLIEIEADNDLTRSNDARVHPSGAFWLGTMGKRAQQGAGAIYRYYRGTLEKLFDTITIPNAICFSPDGKTAYFTDTNLNTLMSVAVKRDDGSLAGKPIALVENDGRAGSIDGAICDANGNIWNARWGANALDCYAPDGGLVETVEIPAKQPSCPAFVGSGKIAVTSAWQGMGPNARQSDPDAGKSFMVDVHANPRFEPRLAI